MTESKLLTQNQNKNLVQDILVCNERSNAFELGYLIEPLLIYLCLRF
jgi:hypothetical protein